MGVSSLCLTAGLRLRGVAGWLGELGDVLGFSYLVELGARDAFTLYIYFRAAPEHHAAGFDVGGSETLGIYGVDDGLLVVAGISAFFSFREAVLLIPMYSRGSR